MIASLRTVVLCIACIVLAWPALGETEDIFRQIDSLPWHTYPSVGHIGSTAQISLDENLIFLGSSGTSRFLELNGNPPRDNNYTLAPHSLNWFAIFSFDPIGYVEDNEQLDADEILRILREQNQNEIAERRRLGYPVIRLDDWAVPPHYDVQTHHLEWGTRLIDEDGTVIVNYTIRLLGRSGVMSAVLVSNPEHLMADVREFKATLEGFEFVPGERYAEYREGDRVAEYGLIGLIVGGAAAAGAASGAFKALGKLLIVGGAAALAAIGALFRRIFTKR